MTAFAIGAIVAAAEIGFAPVARSCLRKPVNARERKIIKAFIAARLADGKMVVVPRGVSGMDEQKERDAAGWLRSRTGISPARRHKLSLRTQEYRAMHDRGYDDEKIAMLLGVAVSTVRAHLRQMRLGQPRFIERLL